MSYPNTTGHTKCVQAYTNQKERADNAIGQLEIWMQFAQALHSSASALSKQFTASQKKVESLTKQTTKLQLAKDNALSELKSTKSALKSAQDKVKEASTNSKAAIANEKRMHAAEMKTVELELTAEKSKTKEKIEEIKKIEKVAKEYKTKMETLEKDMKKLQDKHNKLTLDHAKVIVSGGGGGGKKRAAEPTLDEKKELAEHQSEIRLKEQLMKNQMSQWNQQQKENQQSVAKSKRFESMAQMFGGGGFGGMGNMNQALGRMNDS